MSSNKESDSDDSIEMMDLTQEDDEDVLNYECTESLPSTRSQTSTASSLTSSEASSSIRSRNGRKSVGSLQNKNKTAEKEAKRQRIAEERARKTAASEMNKIYKPGECMKYMCIEMHPSLHGAWYMADVAREASAAGCGVRPTPSLCHPALLMWTRKLPVGLTGNGGQLGLSLGRSRVGRSLYAVEAGSLAELVAERRLGRHLRDVTQLTGSEVTLLVFGLKDYFKSTGRKTINSNRKLMTEIDFEMAVTDLLVSAGIDTVMVNTPNELALAIVQLTKAIAEEPYKTAKRSCDERAEFYMRGDNKKSVSVDRDGNGLSRLWQQMIAILPMSSLETSRSLCAKYKSPLELYEALQSPNSLNELADIGVSRAAVPGSRARRIGPEFAKKLHTLFTAEDGNILIE